MPFFSQNPSPRPHTAPKRGGLADGVERYRQQLAAAGPQQTGFGRTGQGDEPFAPAVPAAGVAPKPETAAPQTGRAKAGHAQQNQGAAAGTNPAKTGLTQSAQRGAAKAGTAKPAKKPDAAAARRKAALDGVLPAPGAHLAGKRSPDAVAAVTRPVMAHPAFQRNDAAENGKILTANPAAAHILNAGEDALIGRSLRAYLTFEAKDEDGAAAAEKLAGQSASGSREDREVAPPTSIRATASVNGRNGTRRRIQYTFSELLVDGRSRGVVFLHDMTELLESREEMQHMMGELAAQLQKTAMADQSKSNFLANMSHELRTPLNAIIGFSSLIEAIGPTNLPSDKLDTYIRDIHSSGLSLLSLVDQVMDLNRIEQGEYQFESKATELSALLRNAIRKAAPDSMTRRRISLTPIREDLRVECDDITLLQCLVTLLNNALTHGDPDTRVTVSAAPLGARIVISIEDDGPGIPDEVLSRLGEPFLRGKAAMARAIGGAGLGLALSKRLIEEQGGVLRLHRLPGYGTRAQVIVNPVERIDTTSTDGHPPTARLQIPSMEKD